MRSVELKDPSCRKDDSPAELTEATLLKSLCEGKLLVVGLDAETAARRVVESLGLTLTVHVDARRLPAAWELF